eukprot:m.979310 g.979310  ORF g.979310 m.979310 type:complete len:296 (+) comp23961_c0_seq45:303-1190(+)
MLSGVHRYPRNVVRRLRILLGGTNKLVISGIVPCNSNNARSNTTNITGQNRCLRHGSPCRSFHETQARRTLTKRPDNDLPANKIMGTPLHRIFIPWATMIETVVSEEDIRASICQFSSHSGLLYALMATISTAGLLWEPASPPDSMMVISSSGLSDSVSNLTGHSPEETVLNPVRFGAGFVGDLTGPLFCVSTFLNIQGLMTSMLVLGRINCLPTGAVKSFVRNNNVTLHTLGWLLMPSVATLSMGIVGVVFISHGEPTATIAVGGICSLGLLTSYQMVSLGYSTESLSEKYRMR